MIADIVIPKNNEAEFVEVAHKLGIKKLLLLYNFDEYDKNKIQEKIDSTENKKINLQIGFIVNQKNINKAAKQSNLLVVKSSDKDRFFVESKKIRIIYGFEGFHKKDYLHQRASGLNHIICELANKNNVCIGLSYSQFFNKNHILASLLIGRITQNIALCNKYKVKTVIGSFSENPYELRASHDIMSLFAILGMDRKKINGYLANGFLTS